MFEKGKKYMFNLLIDGNLYRIECLFEGQGEKRDGVEHGYFQRVKAGGELGFKFCWDLETAKANMPVTWGADKETWG